MHAILIFQNALQILVIQIVRISRKKEFSTEWFYTDIDLIHLAFITAEEEYGGENLLYYFSGLDPDTGEQMGSINEIALEKKKKFPNYSGNITYSV
jgi:hypothetical protein